MGLLYSKSFYGLTGLSKRLPFPKRLRPAAGALGVGLLALALPEVVSTGYGWVQQGMDGQLSHLPLLVILALPFADPRDVTVDRDGRIRGSVRPGDGVGAFTGLAVWRLLLPVAPFAGSSPTPYVVIGMMALFGAIARAPLANILMVAQMTGSIAIVGPPWWPSQFCVHRPQVR